MRRCFDGAEFRILFAPEDGGDGGGGSDAVIDEAPVPPPVTGFKPKTQATPERLQKALERIKPQFSDDDLSSLKDRIEGNWRDGDTIEDDDQEEGPGTKTIVEVARSMAEDGDGGGEKKSRNRADFDSLFSDDESEEEDGEKEGTSELSLEEKIRLEVAEALRAGKKVPANLLKLIESGEEDNSDQEEMGDVNLPRHTEQEQRSFQASIFSQVFRDAVQSGDVLGDPSERDVTKIARAAYKGEPILIKVPENASFDKKKEVEAMNREIKANVRHLRSQFKSELRIATIERDRESEKAARDAYRREQEEVSSLAKKNDVFEQSMKRVQDFIDEKTKGMALHDKLNQRGVQDRIGFYAYQKLEERDFSKPLTGAEIRGIVKGLKEDFPSFFGAKPIQEKVDTEKKKPKKETKVPQKSLGRSTAVAAQEDNLNERVARAKKHMNRIGSSGF